MKKIFLLLSIATLTLVGCNKTPAIYWENIEIEKEGNGVTALIGYPFRFGGVDSVTNKINSTVEATLKTGFTDDCPGCSLDSTLTAFIEAKGKDSIMLPVTYDLRSSGSVYRSKTIASVMLDMQYYTGGANSQNNVVYLNFDGKTGNIVPNNELFTSMDSLTLFTRAAFEKEIATKEGYVMFDSNISQLQLPASIGFDSVGVVLFYNLYEVAPRSSGTVKVVLPYSEVKELLKFDLTDIIDNKK